jgi:hypothetical protein
MQRRAWLGLLAASVCLNLILAVAWWRSTPAERPQRPAITIFRPVVTNLLRPIRTNLVIQPRLLTWADLESPNYSIYIANLRGIGCPEETVRDIIVADVNQIFSARRDREVTLPAQQWWRAEPDPEVAAAAQEMVAALDDERRQLLTQLLGPGWDTEGRHFASPQPLPALDGSLLGALPAEVKAAVHAVEAGRRAALRELREAAAREGRPVSAREEAAVEQRARAQLGGLLGPAELEEYSLRYSPHAARLRAQLRNFEPTPDEFRALFRATEPLERELAQLADETDAASVLRRRELEARREAAVREALGGERFAYHQLAQQAGFIEARDTALKLGVGAEAVLPLYQINLAASEETRRVLADSSLTPEEQTRQLALLEAQRLETLRRVLGEDAFRRLQLPNAP